MSRGGHGWMTTRVIRGRAMNRTKRASSVVLFVILAVTSPALLTAQKRDSASQNSLIAACKAKDSKLTTNECATWLKRADFARKASCPDTSATAACASFQELLSTSDVDLLDDFAQKDHVYVCFRPREDIFMEIYFLDASNGVWSRKDNDPREIRVEHFGGAGIAYYKEGIGSGDMSFHDMGTWTSIAYKDDLAANQNDPSLTTFQGDRILIQGSHFEANEKYKNEAGTETNHSLTLQLSTGRFVESYKSSNLDKTNSGRCLALPPAFN